MAALLAVACAYLDLGSLRGVRETVQQALDAVGPDAGSLGEHVQAMIVSGACNLPLNVVRELL
jgi:hypothetical protein